MKLGVTAPAPSETSCTGGLGLADGLHIGNKGNSHQKELAGFWWEQQDFSVAVPFTTAGKTGW